MADNTIIQQGRFTGTGNAVDLVLRSDIDWLRVYNTTVLAAGGAATGVEFQWLRGFPAAAQILYTKLAADDSITATYATTGGFTLIDTSDQTPAALNTTVSAVSTAATPLVSATSTAGLSNGDIVRMINVAGAQQLGGMDFTIGNLVANTQFELSYMAQLGGAGTTGSFRRIPYDPIYYPRRRFISTITQAASAVVELTVTHGYTVGQEVRFLVPAAYGMTEMNNLTGTITAVATNTVTVDIDSSAFTAFAFPATAAVPFTPAVMVPVGEAAEESYVNLLDDATTNTGYIGIQLAAGTTSPAGALNDVIYWVAGKSFSVTNE
jgi:hypothetical protein